MLKETLLVLVGGFCAVFGGVLSTWYRARKTCKIRMEEIIAEKKVEAYEQALLLIGHLCTLLVEDTPAGSYKFVVKKAEWFWNNRPFLPKDFSDNWVTIRIELSKAMRIDRVIQKQEVPDDKKVNQLVDLEEYIRKLAKEAEERIESEFSLTPIKVRHFHKQLKASS